MKFQALLPLIVSRLSKDIETFGNACEHLLASIAMRPLTEDEAGFIRHYCNELLSKASTGGQH
jgi:hypothetical protein